MSKRVEAIDKAITVTHTRLDRLTELRRVVTWAERNSGSNWPFPKEPGFYLDSDGQPLFVDKDGDVSDGFGNSYLNGSFDTTYGPFTKMVPASD
jgi:hypothetical protein